MASCIASVCFLYYVTGGGAIGVPSVRTSEILKLSEPHSFLNLFSSKKPSQPLPDLPLTDASPLPTSCHWRPSPTAKPSPAFYSLFGTLSISLSLSLWYSLLSFSLSLLLFFFSYIFFLILLLLLLLLLQLLRSRQNSLLLLVGKVLCRSETTDVVVVVVKVLLAQEIDYLQ